MNALHQVLSCFSCRICDTVAIALVVFINPLQKGKSRQMGIFQSPPPLKDGETCTLSDEGHLKPSLTQPRTVTVSGISLRLFILHTFSRSWLKSVHFVVE